jgi:hypothetical protein
VIRLLQHFFIRLMHSALIHLQDKRSCKCSILLQCKFFRVSEHGLPCWQLPGALQRTNRDVPKAARRDPSLADTLWKITPLSSHARQLTNI